MNYDGGVVLSHLKAGKTISGLEPSQTQLSEIQFLATALEDFVGFFEANFTDDQLRSGLPDWLATARDPDKWAAQHAAPLDDLHRFALNAATGLTLVDDLVSLALQRRPSALEALHLVDSLLAFQSIVFFASGSPLSHAEVSRRGGIQANIENRQLRDEVWRWCESNLSKFPSVNSAAEEVFHLRLVPLSFDKVRQHISHWSRLRNGRTAPPHSSPEEPI